jgi:hypothetical protein
MRWYIVLLILAAAGTGCATSCPELRQQLDTSRQTVEQREEVIERQKSTIQQVKKTINARNQRISDLEAQIAELDRRLNISYSEQNRYDERIRKITSAVRSFIKEQIKENRTFLTDISLEDVIGNPLISREYIDEDDTVLFDMDHPVPAPGHVNGVGGYFEGSGDIVIKFLRPVGEDYIVTASKALPVSGEEPGERQIDFDKPILVNKGDILVYYLNGPIGAFYDDMIGTNSYFRMPKDRYPAGERVTADAIWNPDQNRRKYSLNYYGIFVDQ